MPAFVPELEPRLPSFDLAYDDPSWLAAVEAVVGVWLDAGALAEARTALDRFRAAAEATKMARLAFASHALLRSRLLLAEGDHAGAATEAETGLAETRAPWWRVRALRALEAAGAASDEALQEAAELERSLGI